MKEISVRVTIMNCNGQCRGVILSWLGSKNRILRHDGGTEWWVILIPILTHITYYRKFRVCGTNLFTLLRVQRVKKFLNITNKKSNHSKTKLINPMHVWRHPTLCPLVCKVFGATEYWHILLSIVNPDWLQYVHTECMNYSYRPYWHIHIADSDLHWNQGSTT